jgi:hypothetical protein
MRKTRWVLVLFVLFVFAGWVQQQETAPTPPPAQARSISSAVAADIKEPTACPANSNDSLEADGIVGRFVPEGVIPPQMKSAADAAFPVEAKKAMRKQHKSMAFSLLSIVVDTRGIPRNLCLEMPAGYGLDAEAARAVSKFIYDPATKNGKPVPFRLNVELNFYLRS